MSEPAADAPCATCGHSWYEHSWIVYTECWQCDCRYFVAELSPAERAAMRARIAAWNAWRRTQGLPEVTVPEPR